MNQLLLDATASTDSWSSSPECLAICIFSGSVLVMGAIIAVARYRYLRKKYPPGEGRIFEISYPGPKAKSIKALLQERSDALYIRLVGQQHICEESGYWKATIECF